MFLTVEETAEYLELEVSDILRLIRERQVRFHFIDGQYLLNTDQFTLFLEERQKAIAEYQAYLDTPIPEDINIKDED